jgi:hypothetical protein
MKSRNLLLAESHIRRWRVRPDVPVAPPSGALCCATVTDHVLCRCHSGRGRHSKGGHPGSPCGGQVRLGPHSARLAAAVQAPLFPGTPLRCNPARTPKPAEARGLISRRKPPGASPGPRPHGGRRSGRLGCRRCRARGRRATWRPHRRGRERPGHRGMGRPGGRCRCRGPVPLASLTVTATANTCRAERYAPADGPSDRSAASVPSALGRMFASCSVE